VQLKIHNIWKMIFMSVLIVLAFSGLPTSRSFLISPHNVMRNARDTTLFESHPLPGNGVKYLGAFEFLTNELDLKVATITATTTTTSKISVQQHSSYENKESLMKARDFISHLFSLPSALLHPHAFKHQDSNPVDVMYFPFVGFCYDTEYSWEPFAPLVSTKTTCRIPPVHETVYGYFVPSGNVVNPSDWDAVERNASI
jgi:hypothetical protein